MGKVWDDELLHREPRVSKTPTKDIKSTSLSTSLLVTRPATNAQLTKESFKYCGRARLVLEE